MRCQRRGAVLLLVTLLLLFFSSVAIALITYSRSEWRAVSVHHDELVLDNLLVAGENILLTVGSSSRQDLKQLGNPTTSPEFYGPQSLHWDEQASDFRLMILPVKQFLKDEPLLFDWTNESAKINLNKLIEWERKYPGHALRVLSELPGMTPEVAESLLHRLGVEVATTPTLNANSPKNIAELSSQAGPKPQQLEDLVGIGNSTYKDWFGSLDVVADQRGDEANKPTSDHQPWSELLTLHSRERNESANGTPRINLNQSDLVSLHRQLSERLGRSMADFVVLFRQFGAGRVGRRTSAAQLSIDFSVPPRFQFQSELDLIGATVAFDSRNGGRQLVTSPLPNDRAAWAGQLESVMDQLTVHPQPVIEGRINIEKAPREVLMAVPGMDALTADQIISIRYALTADRMPWIHPVWLLEKGILDLPAMKKLLPHMTVGGNVLQADLLAFDRQRGVYLRKIVAIDATSPEEGKLFTKDFRNLPLPPAFDQLLIGRAGEKVLAGQ